MKLGISVIPPPKQGQGGLENVELYDMSSENHAIPKVLLVDAAHMPTAEAISQSVLLAWSVKHR